MLVILILTIISITCLFSCLILHFGEHFQFRFCLAQKKIFGRIRASSISYRTSTTDNEVHQTKIICRSCIIPADQEGFDFYPVSLIPYLICVIIAVSLILCELMEIMSTHKNYSELDFAHFVLLKIRSQFQSEAFITLNLKDISDPISNVHETIHMAIFWILSYFMPIIAVWDSLFSFYRYFSTKYVTIYLQESSTAKIIKYFCIYAIPFLIIYLLQMHVYYFIFPILIIAHFCINVWCNWNFSKILIQSTLEMGSEMRNDMLKNIYFMRRSSMIWCCISSFCQAAFMITHCIEIIYFYPILWSIACLSFTLNFIRNRNKVSELFIMVTRTCQCKCKLTKFEDQKRTYLNSVPQNTPIHRRGDSGQNGINIVIENADGNKVELPSINTIDDTANSADSDPEITSPDMNDYINKSMDDFTLFNYNGYSSSKSNVNINAHSNEFDDISYDSRASNHEKTKSNKALQLLGLSPQKSNKQHSYAMTVKNSKHKSTHVKFAASNSNEKNVNRTRHFKANKSQMIGSKKYKPHLSALKLSIQSKSELPRYSNSQKTEITNTPNDTVSTPMLPTYVMKPDIVRKGSVSVMTPCLNKEKEWKFGDDTEVDYNVSYQICAENVKEKVNKSVMKLPMPRLRLPHSTESKSEIVKTKVSAMLRKIGRSTHTSVQNMMPKVEENRVPLSLENKKSSKLDIGLNVLVMQGFYSRKNLISMQELRRYNDK